MPPSSWFGSKSSRVLGKSDDPLRTTLEPAQSAIHAHPYRAGNLQHPITSVKERNVQEEPDDPCTRVDPTQSKRDKGKARENEELFTPQDVVLADVFGFTPPVTPDPGQSTSLDDSDSLPRESTPAGGSAILPSLPIYDPFTGGRIGEHPPVAQQQTTSQSLPTTGDADMWTRLGRILQLQAEVARMHAEMEGVGSSVRTGATGPSGGGFVKLSNPRRKTRGETIPVGDDDDQPAPGADEREGGNLTDTTSESEDEDEAGVFAKRRRDEEFAKLADQFAERKVAIARIMNKLDGLSDALKAFHALPTPIMDLGPMNASRTDTLNSLASDATRTSVTSPPPLRTGFLRPILEPPQIPLLHTKIIPDAEHVDSPVDMHPTQSVLGMGGQPSL
ncbi:hypothetical protein EDC04DRAFT_2620615 [Pisolithus marmoratus]|nr:hypothetical protein EDC04DRAFT_2620615 [Pisolithus marmoratus]